MSLYGTDGQTDGHARRVILL